jgi:hypothetical protein
MAARIVVRTIWDELVPVTQFVVLAKFTQKHMRRLSVRLADHRKRATGGISGDGRQQVIDLEDNYMATYCTRRRRNTQDASRPMFSTHAAISSIG